tara:strand:- start:12 stop:830 length:819 start_codon:yes stop_codon:yes gene_type:complete
LAKIELAHLPAVKFAAWRSAAMSLTPEICGAVLNGDLPALEAFLSAGGDINAPDAMPGDTVLTLAVSVGNIKTIRFLLERGADPNIGGSPIYPLHLARDAQTAELLLANGARVDAQSAQYRFTALALWLSLYGSPSMGHDLETFLVLLRRGASLDARDSSGHDVLEIAQLRLTSPAVPPDRRQALESMIALLTAVRAAGSWKRYSREPSVKLWALRYLALASRARAPPHFIRLFGAAPIPKGAARTRSKRLVGTPLPDEVFAHVLGFWDGNH